MNLQQIAENARKYCEQKQSRKFELEGACHENVIGAADYIRLHTPHDPIIVWGIVSHKPESETADRVQNAPESPTHFWAEIDGIDGIIDVYTNNPLVGDNSQYIDSGIAYGGNKPDCYNTVEKFRYYGQITPYDLCHKDNFAEAMRLKAVKVHNPE